MKLLPALWSVPGRRQFLNIGNGTRTATDYPGMPLAGQDAYFAPARFRDGSSGREASSVAGCQALWADLDCGTGKPFANTREALTALRDWCLQRAFPNPTHIVNSGYGIHAYWVLDKELPRDAWLRVAGSLKSLWERDGFSADPARTSDIASVMRLPGTLNYKRGASAPCVLLKGSDTRVSATAVVSTLVAAGIKTPKPAVTEATTPFPKGDAKAILTKCAQIRAVATTRTRVDEPLWRAALSVLGRCAGGDKLIHTVSKRDPRYDADETDAKFAGTKGPALCSTFEAHSPAACRTCPMHGKVTSPISLGVVPTAEPGAPWGASEQGEFRIGAEGVWLNVPDGKPIKVAHVPIWLESVEMEDENSVGGPGASMRLAYWNFQRRLIHVTMPQVARASNANLMTWLCTVNLVDFVCSPKAFMVYLSEIGSAKQRKDGATLYRSRSGWNKDGFVVGNVVYTPEGPKPCVNRSNDPNSCMLAPTGTLENWKATVRNIPQPDWRTRAALLFGFASPLLGPIKRQGCVVSLTGPGGAGKTSGASLALSIYGRPDLLMESKFTDNAVGDKLMPLNSIPCLFDENGNVPAKRLQEFAKTAANGRNKARSSKTLAIVGTQQWSLVTFITGNKSLLDNSLAEMDSASRGRILEINYEAPYNLADGKALFRGYDDNAGTAAPVYLDWVARNQASIEPIFDKCLAVVTKLGPMNEGARHALWALATGYAAGLIARKLDLIDFDPLPVIKQVAQQFMDARASDPTESERAGTEVAEWLSFNTARVSKWSGTQCLSEVREPIARVDADGIWVSEAHVRRHLQDQGVSRAAYKAWRASSGNEVVNAPRQFTTGAPKVMCHLIPPALFELGEAS